MAAATEDPVMVDLAVLPTVNLDAQITVRLLERFGALAKSENRALLIVTLEAAAREAADRVARTQDRTVVQRAMVKVAAPQNAPRTASR
jgi:ABC-type lipoprotein export system ATPase subunit